MKKVFFLLIFVFAFIFFADESYAAGTCGDNQYCLGTAVRDIPWGCDRIGNTCTQSYNRLTITCGSNCTYGFTISVYGCNPETCFAPRYNESLSGSCCVSESVGGGTSGGGGSTPTSPANCGTECYPGGVGTGGCGDDLSCAADFHCTAGDIYKSQCSGTGGSCGETGTEGYCYKVCWGASCGSSGCTNTPPKQPVLLSPRTASEYTSQFVTLDWKDINSWGTNCSGNSNKYVVYIDDEFPIRTSTARSKIASQGTSDMSFSVDQCKTYYWKVKATNGKGYSNSKIWSFKTDCRISGSVKSEIVAGVSQSAISDVPLVADKLDSSGNVISTSSIDRTGSNGLFAINDFIFPGNTYRVRLKPTTYVPANYNLPIKSTNDTVSYNNCTGGNQLLGSTMYDCQKVGLNDCASGSGAKCDFVFKRALPYDALCEGNTIPTQMYAGETKNVSVTVRNVGTDTWTPAAVKLGSSDPRDNSVWGLSRVNLLSNVIRNNSYTFGFTITAPSVVGTYSNLWEMTQEGVSWFGEQCGQPAVTVKPTPVQGLIWDSTDQTCNISDASKQSKEIQKSQVDGTFTPCIGAYCGSWDPDSFGSYSYLIENVPRGDGQSLCAAAPPPKGKPNFKYELKCLDNSTSGVVTPACALIDVNSDPTVANLGYELKSVGWFTSLDGDVYGGCSGCTYGVSNGIPNTVDPEFKAYLVGGKGTVFGNSDLSVKNMDGNDVYSEDGNRYAKNINQSSSWPGSYTFTPPSVDGDKVMELNDCSTFGSAANTKLDPTKIFVTTNSCLQNGIDAAGGSSYKTKADGVVVIYATGGGTLEFGKMGDKFQAQNDKRRLIVITDANILVKKELGELSPKNTDRADIEAAIITQQGVAFESEPAGDLSVIVEGPLVAKYGNIALSRDRKLLNTFPAEIAKYNPIYLEKLTNQEESAGSINLSGLFVTDVSWQVIGN